MTSPTCDPAVSEYLNQLRSEVDAALDAATRLDSGAPARLVEAIRYTLLAPGKRTRPLLVLLACELTGGNRAQALPAACAVEMIHAFSLIHDDLPAMDDDDLRRGRPTCHIQFDEATAILTGDALQALAFEMIGNLSPPALAGLCCKELALAAGPCRLVGGQMDDISREKGLGVTEGVQALKTSKTAALPLMERIHIRKTGALMRVSLRLGGLVAGAPMKKLDALDLFGVYFGLAFQITDDLLDVLGEEAEVGKRVHKDAQHDKWTYPILIGVDASRKEAIQAVQQAEKMLENVGGAPDSPAYEALRFLVGSLPDRSK